MQGDKDRDTETDTDTEREDGWNSGNCNCYYVFHSDSIGVCCLPKFGIQMEQCALCWVSNAIDFLIAGLNIFQLAPVWLHLAAKHTNTQNGKSNRYKFQSFRINFREDGNERETRVITSVTITYLEQLSKLMKLFCLGILNWQIDVISEVTIFHCNIYGNTGEMTFPKHFGNVQFFF